MKKGLIAISSVVVCAILAVAIYFCIPKTNKLVVDAKDVSVSVGQKVKLEYSSTISDAVLSFFVKDKNIAKVNINGDDVFVTGCEEGETKITVLARYKDARFEENVNVVVANLGSEEPDSNNDDQNTPSDNNTDSSLDETEGDKAGDNSGDNNVEETFDEDEVEITFVESNFVNFEVDGNVIKIQANKKAIFSIETNINGTLDIEADDHITATKLTSVGNKALSLKAQDPGEYDITFVVAGQYRKTHKVQVV